MIRLLEPYISLMQQENGDVNIMVLGPDGQVRDMYEVSKASPNQIKNIIMSLIKKI